MRRVVNCCWSAFKWGFALLLLAALTAGGYLYFRLDEEIRGYAERLLASHYQNLNVQVGGARFVPGRGVTVFDVSLAAGQGAEATNAAGPLLHIDEVRLAGRFEMRQLIDGDQVVERVIVRRPRLSATRRLNGAWTFQQMLPLPKGGGDSPPLEILDATLVVADEAKPDAAPLVFRNVNLQIAKATNPDRSAGAYQVTGAIDGGIAKKITIDARVDVETGAVEASSTIDSLRLSDELLASAPMVSRAALGEIELRATASANLRLATTGRGAPLEFNASFSASDGVVNHPALPRPLTGVVAAGSLDNDGLEIRQLSAKSGSAGASVACRRAGWGSTAPISLRGRLTELPLDENLQRVLPPHAKMTWNRLRPSGEVDVTLTVTFDGVRWQPDVTIDCRELSIQDAEKFPYPLTGGRGTIRYVDRGAAELGGLELKLDARAEGRPVVLTGEFDGLPCPSVPGPRRPTGALRFHGPRMQVTPRLLAALGPHPNAAKIANALSPTGEFAVAWRLDVAPDRPKPSLTIDLEAIDCAINYDRFAYPLEHVRGRIHGEGGVWTFDGFESRGADGLRVVTARGSVAPENGRPTFRMWLDATAAPLDRTLRQALPAEVQHAWDQLRPRGRVDFNTVVTYTVGDRKPRIDLALRPHERSVSIEPTFFQYRFDRLDGEAVMTDGRITITGGRAEHGRTRFASDGSWAPDGQGGWRFELNRLAVDYLGADHDLLLAAPIALRRIVDGLRPEGSFGVHNSRLVFTHRPRAPLQTEWDLQLDCHQANVQLGVPIEGVSGDVRLAGAVGANSVAYGEVRLDSLFWNGLQLTNVRGPFWVDQNECRFGRGVPTGLPGVAPTEVTGAAYGGSVSMNTRVAFGQLPRYALGLGFQGVELDRFRRDYLNATTPFAGRVAGRLTLQGRGSSIHNVDGDGSIEVSEANLYKLPVMVSLLKVLRNRTPDTNAFDVCRADFTMQGEHLQFSKLDLIGDAVSLYGRGDASLDKDVNLTFHTIVGRNAPSIPFLRSLVGSASEQLWQLTVQGTVDNPLVETTTLPVVGNVLDQLRADLRPQPLTQPAGVPRAAALRRTTK